MLNIAICDDIKEDIELIESKADEILKELGVEYKIYALDNKEDTFFYLGSGNIDILLLDISMPEISGYEVAKMFGDKVDFIIFVSCNNEYVFEAVKFNPYRFVRKTHLNELSEAFESIIEYYNDSTYYLEVKTTDNGRAAIKLKDIVYIESHGHNIVICAEKYDYEVRESIKNIETRLNDNFMRVHRGFIINLNKIYLIKRFDVSLGRNGRLVNVPLKRSIYTEVKQRFVEVMRR